MIRRQHAVREFFPDAEAMREALDASFKDPFGCSLNWHYFCVPRVYTYLSTAPQEIIPKAIFEHFMKYLRLWCIENVGLVPMNLPSLHLMVDGCKLELHSDFHNGVWGYVYSLTRWQNRRFSGGETLLMRDGVPSYKKHQVDGEGLYELIPAHFNQLLLFDDRIVHGTPIIEGSMDPLDGRIALVGHLRAASPLVSGHIEWAVARTVILESLPHLRDRIRSYKDVQGTVTYKLTVDSTGTVQTIATLTDNLVTSSAGYGHSDAVATVKSLIHQSVANLKFPAAIGKSEIVVPVLVPLPDLRHLEFVVPHHLSREAVGKWVEAHLTDGNALGLQGDWQRESFIVREPVAGSIRVEPRHIALSFDPPMWVPSQRERFEVTLTEQLRATLTSAES